MHGTWYCTGTVHVVCTWAVPLLYYCICTVLSVCTYVYTYTAVLPVFGRTLDFDSTLCRVAPLQYTVGQRSNPVTCNPCPCCLSWRWRENDVQLYSTQGRWLLGFGMAKEPLYRIDCPYTDCSESRSVLVHEEAVSRLRGLDRSREPDKKWLDDEVHYKAKYAVQFTQ